MPRAYFHSDARCRQLERLVRQNPGATVGALAHAAGLAYKSAFAYMRRLVREKRVEVTREAPATPRGSTQRFYPPRSVTMADIAAATERAVTRHAEPPPRAAPKAKAA